MLLGFASMVIKPKFQIGQKFYYNDNQTFMVSRFTKMPPNRYFYDSEAPFVYIKYGSGRKEWFRLATLIADILRGNVRVDQARR